MEGVAKELEEIGYTKENVDKYLGLFDEVASDVSGIAYLKEKQVDFKAFYFVIITQLIC